MPTMRRGGGIVIMTRVHKLDEFSSLPWDKLEAAQCTKSWSYGRGGHGFDDWTYTISFLNEDDEHWEIWELPAAIGAMLKISKEIGANEVRRNLQQLIYPPD